MSLPLPRLKLVSPATFIGKQGGDVISFGSGQPDLPPPEEVTEGLRIRRDLRYGLVQGELSLREALARDYPGATPSSFVVTNGASEALDIVLRVLGEGGGKILLPRPFYYSYLPLIRYAGLEPVFTDLREGRIDPDDFRRNAPECAAVLINSPSNPTGRVEDVATLKEIERVAADQGMYVISDEVYKDLIYERENYLISGERVVTINSFSKTYAMCGARVGYLWSRDQGLVDRCIEMKTHTSMNTSLVSQDMALRAMGAPRSYVATQLGIWRQRRDLIYAGLCRLGLDLWRPEGAFYVLPRVPHPRIMVEKLYLDYKVVTYLGEWFGAPDRIRLSYALSADLIEEGLERFHRCLEEVAALKA